MAEGEVVLDIPARSAMVSTARLLVARLAATRRELPADRVEDLKLAVSEACSNAIESYGPRPPDRELFGQQGPAPEVPGERVSVLWTEDDDALHVWITDQGSALDQDGLDQDGLDREGLGASRATPAESVRLGMGLIRALVDESVCTSGSPGTVVQMTMHCPRVATESY